MATLGGYYLNPHQSQYGHSARLASMGCTPTSGVNGANASSGGRTALNGDQLLSHLAHSEETDPRSPGWSLEDAKKALGRVGIPLDVRSGQGWAAMQSALNTGHYVELQGDSDQFANNTCSGAFNGDHAIGVHPARRVVNGLAQHWIDDPICKVGRWEYDYIIRRYAVKLNPAIRFAVFTRAVPRAVAPAPAPAPGVPTAPAASSPTRFKVVIIGPTRLYSRAPGPAGTLIGTIRAATYVTTRAKVAGAWWYKIATGKRTGQVFKGSPSTKVTIVS